MTNLTQAQEMPIITLVRIFRFTKYRNNTHRYVWQNCDQAGILMLGQSSGTAAAGSLVSVLNSTNYGFLGDIATSNGGAVAAEAAPYVLSNIGFNIVRMDMPTYFYEAMTNDLASGVVYKLYYPNYRIFTGQSTTNK